MIEEKFAEHAGRRYKLMTIHDFRKFRELATNTNTGWSSHYKDKNLVIESRHPDDNSTTLNIIRARRVMKNVPPRVLYDQLHDASYRKTWDNNMIEGYCIVMLDKHNEIGYYAAKFPWPLSNRDFCNQRSWMEFDNGEYIIFNHSEPHSDCPVKSHFIRATSFLTGYYIQPHEDGGTMLTYVTHSDPCGSIPKSVINFVMTKGAPRLLDMCEKCSEAYPAYAAERYPPGHEHPWTTKKMNWDSKYLYPEDVPSSSEAKHQDPSVVNSKGPDGEELLFVTRHNEPSPSLVPLPVGASRDTLVIIQYRELIQGALDAADRSFLVEGKVPSTKQYILRLKSFLEGVRQTL